MTTAASLLMEDFNNKRGSLRHIDVELSSGELRIFYAPVMNVSQQSAIFKHINLNTGEMDTEVFLESLLVRALNEDGTRMFADIDRKELRTKVDAGVLQDIAARMGGVMEQPDPKD